MPTTSAFAQPFDQLLALEEQHHLWEPEWDGFKLWPLVRTVTYLELWYRNQDTPTPTRDGSSNTYLLRAKWKYYLRTLPFLLFSRQQYSALCLAANLSRHERPDNPAYSFDRLYGDYYDCFEHPLILESMPSHFIAAPDLHYQPAIYSQDVLWIAAYGWSKLQRLSAQANLYLSDFADAVGQAYGVPEIRNNLINLMASYLKQYQAMKPLLSRWVVPKTKNRFAIIETASYMGRGSIITKILHDHGFYIIEPQHGLVNQEHLAYNYPLAPEVQPLMRPYLPDALLTYGSYWSGQVRMPCEVVAIGLPHMAKTVERSDELKAGQILVVSQPAYTDELFQIACQLARAFPNQPVIFKLHPAELDLEEHYRQQQCDNLQLLSQVDIYPLIGHSEIIVGLFSTVLVEATAYKDKRVFYQIAEFLPPDIGEHFTTIEELIELIRDPLRGHPRVARDAFWADDWQARLQAFLQSHLKVE